MDILGRLFLGPLSAESTGAPSPFDDYWYQPRGLMTPAGLRMDPAAAQKVSAWFRGRDILATSLAMLPLRMNVRLPDDGGRDAAPNHPLDDVIGRKPNEWQDSFGWRRQLMFHLIDYGNAYNWMIPGARGIVHELRPIHPTLVTPQLIGGTSQSDGGRKVFAVKNPTTGQTTTHTQDEIFHLCGASDDGVVGKGILEFARDNLALGVVIEQYAARLFSKGTLNGGVIQVPGVMNDEASKRMAKSFVTAQGDWHLPKVLEQGATWVDGSKGMTPENAQMLLSRKFSINDVARWLGLPPHMLADLDRSTNNNIEQQSQEFITYNLGPWLTLFEFGINDQLVTVPAKYYAEFVRDALVRGDIAARWASYVDAISTGTFTRNEVRVMENRKKLPGLDTPLDPAFLTGKQSKPQGAKPDPQPDAQQAMSMQAHAIAVSAASRLLRKEIQAVQKIAVRNAADQDAYAAAVTEFYNAHIELVVSTLHMTSHAALEYCAGQAAQLLGEIGIRALDNWAESHYAEGLAGWALDVEAA